MFSNNNQKVLAIQFQYLGDAVFITPALFTLKQQFPNLEIHILVAKEVAPVLENLPWIKKVWAMPRSRGKFNFKSSWPIIKALRFEKFDSSVAFGCNDRSAVISLIVGAKDRLGSVNSKKLLHKIAYTKGIPDESLPKPYTEMHLNLLYLGWGIKTNESPCLQIFPSPNLLKEASVILRPESVICHIGTSQVKKEWSIEKWIEFYNLASACGYQLVFSAGNNKREQDLITQLKLQVSTIEVLPPIKNLALYIAILDQANVVISGDTGPFHFAAGLGKKIIGLFGCENSIIQVAPNYQLIQTITSNPCTCVGTLANHQHCQSPISCMSSISPHDVLQRLVSIYPNRLLTRN